MQAGTVGQLRQRRRDGRDRLDRGPPDGSALYATTKESDGVVVFERAADGTIAQRPGTAGCITETGFEDADLPCTEGTCEDGRALLAADGVIASDDGRTSTPPPGSAASTPSTSSRPRPGAAGGKTAASPPQAQRRVPERQGQGPEDRQPAQDLSRENERRARKATFVTSEAAKDRLNEAADRGRRQAKGMRLALRRANRMVKGSASERSPGAMLRACASPRSRSFPTRSHSASPM